MALICVYGGECSGCMDCYGRSSRYLYRSAGGARHRARRPKPEEAEG